MKVLMIAPEPFFTPRGTPFSVYYRTLVAAEQGVRIDLLTYGQGADVAIPGVRIVRIPRFSWLGPVPVGPSFQKLFLDIWTVLWTVMLLLRHRYDVVHAHAESVFWCRYSSRCSASSSPMTCTRACRSSSRTSASQSLIC
jgi:hypothetical protein